MKYRIRGWLYEGVNVLAFCYLSYSLASYVLAM